MSAQPAVGPAPAVLLVDDDPALREALSEVLEVHGYQVIVACNGREGLQAARGHAGIAAIILDLNMPILNGYGMLEALRADPLLAPIPVMVVTAAPDEDVRARYMLTKPFDAEQLLALLGQLTGFRTAQLAPA